MAWIGAIVNALSCSDLYKYVFNSMRCKSDCCHHYFTCDCETDEIDLPSDNNDLCCFGGNVNSDYTNTSDDHEIISNS